MNQLTRLITNTIGFIRDFFIYLIPALPSSLLFLYFFNKSLKAFFFDFKDFISPTIFIIILIFIIYIFGRFLYLISNFIFDFYRILFSWIPFKANKERKKLNEKVEKYLKKKSFNKFGLILNRDELEVYTELKIFTSDPHIFQIYLERYNLFLGYNRTIAAGFFILVFFLLIFKLKSVFILYPVSFFLLSVLFYFNWIGLSNIYDTHFLMASLFIDNNPQKYSTEIPLKNDQENDDE